MTGDPTTAPRELAARWVVWHVHGDEPHDDMNAKPLTPAERERLFSWVRERMAARLAEIEREGQHLRRADDHSALAREDLAHDVGEFLGLSTSHAWTLCEASGWPS